MLELAHTSTADVDEGAVALGAAGVFAVYLMSAVVAAVAAVVVGGGKRAVVAAVVAVGLAVGLVGLVAAADAVVALRIVVLPSGARCVDLLPVTLVCT